MSQRRKLERQRRTLRAAAKSVEEVVAMEQRLAELQAERDAAVAETAVLRGQLDDERQRTEAARRAEAEGERERQKALRAAEEAQRVASEQHERAAGLQVDLDAERAASESLRCRIAVLEAEGADKLRRRLARKTAELEELGRLLREAQRREAAARTALESGTMAMDRLEAGR